MYGRFARLGSTPVKLISAVRAFIAHRGPLFLINQLILAALAAWLVSRIIGANPDFERQYLHVRVVALGVVGIFGYLSLVLGRRGNARLPLFFAATCCAGEILMRTVGPVGAGVNNDRPWREPRPYFMFGGPSDGRAVNLLPAMDEGVGRPIRLNAEGFRIEREIVNPKPADEVRIFVLGGSTVLSGRRSETTIPGVIEAQLQANGLPRARVYNFGVLNFVSGQELSLLVHRLIDMKPDLVIAYDGGNDVYEPWLYDPRPGYPFNYAAEEEAMAMLANGQGDAKTLAGFARDSALVQAFLGTTDWFERVLMTIKRLRGTVSYGSPAWKEAVVNTYARNLTVMCRIARANGASFAGFFQPLLAYSKLAGNQAAATGGDGLVRDLRDHRERALRAVAARFPAPSVEAGCRFGDLSDVLENDAGAFTDAIHVDDKTNQLIGGRIAADLLAWPALQAEHTK